MYVKFEERERRVFEEIVKNEIGAIKQNIVHFFTVADTLAKVNVKDKEKKIEINKEQYNIIVHILNTLLKGSIDPTKTIIETMLNNFEQTKVSFEEDILKKAREIKVPPLVSGVPPK